MKVYYPGGRRDHTLCVTPAVDDKTNSDWKHGDGTDRQFTVKFIAGVAEVPGGMGRWLIEKGYAQRTPSSIVRPSAHAVVTEPRPRTHRVLETVA